MQLAELRKTVKLSAGFQDGEFDDVDIDRALRLCLNEAQKICQFSRGTTTVTLSSGIATFDVTEPDFAPERVIQTEIGYVDKGTWQTGQNYARRDVVQNTGTPDGFLYACTNDHTSDAGNQPPTDLGYWLRVPWKRGTRVEQVGFSVIQSWLSGRDRPAFTFHDDVTMHGLPCRIGWSPEGQGVVWPVPAYSVPLVVTYAKPLPEWTPGTKARVDLEIPDEYVEMIVWFGVPGALYFHTRGERDANANWERFREYLNETRGMNKPDAGPYLMDWRKY